MGDSARRHSAVSRGQFWAPDIDWKGTSAGAYCMRKKPQMIQGGGQPGDQGMLVPQSTNGSSSEDLAIRVVDVQRRNLDAVHFATGELPVGSEVEVRVDVDRRTDLMSQHTGQHVSHWLYCPTRKQARESVRLPRSGAESLFCPLCNAAISSCQRFSSVTCSWTRSRGP